MEDVIVETMNNARLNGIKFMSVQISTVLFVSVEGSQLELFVAPLLDIFNYFRQPCRQ